MPTRAVITWFFVAYLFLTLWHWDSWTQIALVIYVALDAIRYTLTDRKEAHH